MGYSVSYIYVQFPGGSSQPTGFAQAFRSHQTRMQSVVFHKNLWGVYWHRSVCFFRMPWWYRTRLHKAYLNLRENNHPACRESPGKEVFVYGQLKVHVWLRADGKLLPDTQALSVPDNRFRRWLSSRMVDGYTYPEIRCLLWEMLPEPVAFCLCFQVHLPDIFQSAQSRLTGFLSYRPHLRVLHRT